MAQLNIDQGDWIVVCDGKKALWLGDIGDAVFPNLKTQEIAEHPVPLTREQGSDASGRGVGSVDAARSAIEQTDWHEASERSFLEEVAQRLDAAVLAGEAEAMVVVAPPRALGVLRRAFSPHVRRALRAEIDKDLVRMPVHEIEKHLFG